MLNDQQRPDGTGEEHDPPHEEAEFRDIHPLTPRPPPSVRSSGGRRGEYSSHHRSPAALSVGSDAALSEQLTTMSREFSAMLVAGSALQLGDAASNVDNDTTLARIGEEDRLEETNPLAIVPDTNPIPSPPPEAVAALEEVSVAQVKKEEVESKISAWQTAEVAKLNNRFKREEVEINGWESHHVEKATAWLKKIERKSEEQRARAIEKAQNDVVRARRKAEEKRASAEAKRGTKAARVLELANFMRAVRRAPSKRSFY
ncbi:remorin-like [Ananas comosus]|uniref:Remorin n=1 Tax=Ananas comosus TaxID=4615 RepID=A0A199UX79_ANACO|nr:remorin-like [Ananas comosus]OAY69235.1 Remorin [Ananas comosus]